jgi:hypothetical protein
MMFLVCLCLEKMHPTYQILVGKSQGIEEYMVE